MTRFFGWTTLIVFASSLFRSRCLAPAALALTGYLVPAICVGQVAPQRAPVQPAPQATGKPLDTLTLAATNVGIKRCLPAISRLSSLVLNGSTGNDVLVDWDRKNADGMPFFSLSGVEYKNASLAFSLTAVPDSQGGCSVAAERISVAPFTCRSIALQELGGYRAVQLLPTFTVYVDEKDAGASVSLIDSPPGCLLIRRHVQFDWKEPVAGAAQARVAGNPAAAPGPVASVPQRP